MEHVQTLSSDAYEGRATGTEGGRKARAYLEAAFETAGLQRFGDTYVHPFAGPGDGTGNNVVGYLEGTRLPDAYIVISAHYDHLGVRDGTIFNGADDNASGTAALLAFASYFAEHPPEHSILFAAFDAEEQGLRGARAFVEAPPVPREDIVFNLNMDMVSRGDAGELYVAGLYHYPAFEPYLDAAAERSGIDLRYGHDRPGMGADDWTNSSDHAPFHQASIPFLYFGVEDHPDYHRPTDDVDRIDATFFDNAAETILDVLLELDQGIDAALK
jgi:Zn-dependent M28 family amino/carboxypeptidase